MDPRHLYALSHRTPGPLKNVRLTRKLATVLNGVDLSKFSVGDVLLLPESVAAMLIAEGWAESVAEKSSNPADHSQGGPRLRR